MKKQLLTFIFALGTFAAANAQDAPSVEWAKSIDGPTTAGDQSTTVSIDKDGNAYWFGGYGSGDAGTDITFGGEVLFSGAEYSGTSQNANFTMLKTNPDGEKLWVVYSNSGDFAANVGGSATTSDGGVVFVASVRHTDGHTDKNINFVQADGTNYPIEWTCEQRYYRMIVGKISAHGQFEWHRMIDVSTDPTPKADKFLSDCYNLGTLALDDNENIYIALNYRNVLTVGKADNTVATFTPTNNATWNGNAQTACGDFMILGLDKQGYYRNALTLTGEATATYCQKVVYSDGKILAQGYINGKDGSSVALGSRSFTATTGVINPLLVSMDTDFNVNWAKCLNATKNGNSYGFQNCGIDVVDGKLYLVAQWNNLKLEDSDSENFVNSTAKTREGLVLKLDAATGNWLGATKSSDGFSSITALTGYLSVIANPEKPETIYVVGYAMDKNAGVFLRRYDAETLDADPDASYALVYDNTMTSYQTCAYDGNNCSLYLTARHNAAVKTLGGGDVAKPTGWAVLATKVKLPADMQTTGVGAISTVVDDFDAPVEYYNLQGVRVATPTSGLYIRRQGATATKVFIR